VVLLLDDAELKSSTSTPLVEADHDASRRARRTVSTEIDWLQKQPPMAGPEGIAKVVEGGNGGQNHTETAYYLLSRVLSPERLNQVVQHTGASETACTGG